MERNVKFDEILEKIREYGIDYSLNDDEIDGCLLKSLYSWKIKNAKSFLLLNGQHNKVKVDKHKAKSNRVSKWLLACIIIVLISCLTVFYSDEITGFIFRFASTYVLYPLLRLIRVLSLPLITNFDLSVYNKELCLVDNPFYNEEGSIGCDVYKYSQSFESVNSIDQLTFHKKFLDFMKSVQIMNNHTKYTFDDVKTLYHKKHDLIHSGSNTVTSTIAEISNLEDLINYSIENVKESNKFHVQWETSSVGPARFISQLFPRLHFMKNSYEICLQKMMMFDLKDTKAYYLTFLEMPQVWYVQASGKRSLRFTPLEHCSSSAEPWSVIMNPGDIIYFHQPIWNIVSGPVKDDNSNTDQQQEMTISFMGSFTT